MSDYKHDQELYDDDDDERFYEETAYNEEYYIERERELIRQSNLDLELEELEEKRIRELREEGLLRPVLIKPALTQTHEHDFAKRQTLRYCYGSLRPGRRMKLCSLPPNARLRCITRSMTSNKTENSSRTCRHDR